MNCALEEVIAENSGLAFQICLGGSGSCLPPVRLGSVPYAVKTTFAAVVEQARRAQVAARSEWAHRLTADAQLTAPTALGKGYFDFYTHPAADVTALYDAAAYAPLAQSGFLQWAAVTPSGRSLHLVGRDHATGALRPLSRVNVFAPKVTARGELHLRPGAQGLTLAVEGPAKVTGDSTVDGLAVSGAVTISSGGLTILAGGLTVTGDATVDGAFDATGRLSVLSGGASVAGNVSVEGPLTVGGATTVSAGGLASTGVAQVSGAATVASHLTVGGGLVVKGLATIAGVATFEQGYTTSNAPDLRYLQYGGENRPLTLSGTTTFSGPLIVEAASSFGGRALTGGRLERAAAAPVACDAAHQGYLYLDTGAAAVMVCSGDSFKPLAMTVCGDGKVELGEDCDDGDADDGDGCAKSCIVEAGYTCTGDPSVCTQ
ncbi:MAG: hypothetical protein IV100_08650 [Myxococcales bacterium]|nr:hypothetical protein [Myxococcales bacterium]